VANNKTVTISEYSIPDITEVDLEELQDLLYANRYTPIDMLTKVMGFTNIYGDNDNFDDYDVDGKYFYWNLTIGKRTTPKKLVNKDIKKMSEEWLAERDNYEFVPKDVKQDIKVAVDNKYLRVTPMIPTDIPIVLDISKNKLYIFTDNMKVKEEFEDYFQDIFENWELEPRNVFEECEYGDFLQYLSTQPFTGVYLSGDAKLEEWPSENVAVSDIETYINEANKVDAPFIITESRVCIDTEEGMSYSCYLKQDEAINKLSVVDMQDFDDTDLTSTVVFVIMAVLAFQEVKNILNMKENRRG
jgi:hypothetical protein